MGIIQLVKKAIKASVAENAAYTKEKYGKIPLNNISDPFAKEISWLPNHGWWADHKTNILVKDSQWNYRYKVSYWSMSFAGIFIMIGAFFAYGISQLILQDLSKWHAFKYEDWILFMIFPVLFLMAGIWVYTRFSGKKEFNLASSCCYIWKRVIRFDEIYAVQLIAETIHRRPVYQSYELNLVLKDQERIGVVDHGDKEAILSDARLISNALWVPLWHVDTF